MAGTETAKDSPKSAATQQGTSKPEPAVRKLTLRQKLIEMRKACPELIKKKHSDNVSYKYAKIYDVWEQITPVMNTLGVDFEIISEKATHTASNGDPIFWEVMQTKTRNGDKLMFIYEADILLRWTDIESGETLNATVHAVGWNDDPAKAKGAAHTYALKYYLFERFSIDQGEDDPDNTNNAAQRQGGSNEQQYRQQSRQWTNLSAVQLSRLYKKAEAAGMTKERTDARILERYKKKDPATLTTAEYEEICGSLDKSAAKRAEKAKQQPQGGNEDAQ